MKTKKKALGEESLLLWVSANLGFFVSCSPFHFQIHISALNFHNKFIFLIKLKRKLLLRTPCFCESRPISAFVFCSPFGFECLAPVIRQEFDPGWEEWEIDKAKAFGRTHDWNLTGQYGRQGDLGISRVFGRNSPRGWDEDYNREESAFAFCHLFHQSLDKCKRHTAEKSRLEQMLMCALLAPNLQSLHLRAQILRWLKLLDGPTDDAD